MFRSQEILNSVLTSLQSEFGPIDSRSPCFDFNHTSYYLDEMGADLTKQFFAFGRIARRETIVDMKHFTLEIEKTYSELGKRKANLDPAYLELSKLVVTSRKNFAHRIYIGQRVFGDVQLVFRHGSFAANDWTYPDYTLPDVTDFFMKARKTYSRQLESDWHD